MMNALNRSDSQKIGIMFTKYTNSHRSEILQVAKDRLFKLAVNCV